MDLCKIDMAFSLFVGEHMKYWKIIVGERGEIHIVLGEVGK